MSIFTAIKTAENTFVAWFEKEVAKFQADAPKIETFVENGVAYAATTLKIVLAQVEPGSAAANLITKAIQDLLTLSAVTYDAGAHPTLASGFNDVVTNLGALEQAAGVKSATSVATVGKVISTITAIAQAVAAIVPVVA